MPKYLLLLYSDPAGWRELSPDEMQKAIEKFMAWGQKLRNDGIYLGSNKLTNDAGKVMRGKNRQPRVTDGPYSETKEVLGGYYMIEAPNYEKAVEFSRYRRGAPGG